MAPRRVRLRAPNPEAAEPERPPPALASELLEEIFLRVASPADLARASTACVSFRRLITDHHFLRRYRSIHPPQILGFISISGFHPVQKPHPSTAVARSVDRVFSFSHLPRPNSGWHYWYPCDVRNGRVLAACRAEVSRDWGLAVCDPLSRRYLLLPPITDDQLASVELLEEKNILFRRVSFIPSGSRGPAGGIEEDTSFSVILWMHANRRLGVFVFSSVSGCWSVGMSTSCNDLGLNGVGVGTFVSGHCAYDCFYWKILNMSTLIKLDMNSMQFCTVNLPPGHDQREIAIVESGESKVGMFSMSCEATSVDYYTFSQNDNEMSHEWHMMSTIPLPAHYSSICYIGCPAEGYIFIACVQDGDNLASTILSLEIKSFNFERVIRRSHPGLSYPYFGFPPSMSPRRI